MKTVSLPLKPEIEISLFDDGNETPSYLVSLSQYNWKISQIAYYILSELSLKESYDDIVVSIQQKYNIIVNYNEIAAVIKFVETNGLTVGSEIHPKPAPKNKHLWGRITILPQNLVSRVRVFTFLFQKWVMIPLFTFSCAWLGYILYMNTAVEVASKVHQMSFGEMVCCYLIIGIIGLFHEFGHSSALVMYKEKPGRIGAGVYFIMPVFFSDVTRAWRLRRSQRIIVDLGGIYLQLLTMVTLFTLNKLFVNSETIELAVLLSAMEILSNLNPFIQLDGYWVLCDYLGVTNIRSVICELLTAPFKKSSNKRHEIKGMHTTKKVVLYVYMFATAGFFVYFGKMMISSVQMAYYTFSRDILWLINGMPLVENLSIINITAYLSSRLSSFVVMIFVIRLILLLIKKAIILLLKRREKHC